MELSFTAYTVKSTIVPVAMKNCRQFKPTQLRRKRLYNDPYRFILKCEVFTLTLVNLLSSKMTLRRVWETDTFFSKIVGDNQKFLSWLNPPWSWRLRFFSLQRLLKTCCTILFSLEHSRFLQFLSPDPNTQTFNKIAQKKLYNEFQRIIMKRRTSIFETTVDLLTKRNF